jgi:ketosteroid isomerase-like protein
VDERAKIELQERGLAAWNIGDLEAVTATFTPDFEWDLTRSDIPGQSRLHRGKAEYLTFARAWRESLGPTQVTLEEAFELDDGRLFVLILQSGAGARSGVAVDVHYVQIISFAGDKACRVEVFTDERKGRAAAGLDN